MRTVLHERSVSQGAITFEKLVDDRIPVDVPVALEGPKAPESSIAVAEVSIHESEEQKPPSLPQEHATTHIGSKLLTHVESLSSERYTLEQALLPVGTGLSLELTWDGPGTCWEDLGLPSKQQEDEVSEHSLLLTLMISRIGIKTYGW